MLFLTVIDVFLVPNIYIYIAKSLHHKTIYTKLLLLLIFYDLQYMIIIRTPKNPGSRFIKRLFIRFTISTNPVLSL
jgi:hypothetical protein